MTAAGAEAAEGVAVGGRGRLGSGRTSIIMIFRSETICRNPGRTLGFSSQHRCALEKIVLENSVTRSFRGFWTGLVSV